MSKFIFKIFISYFGSMESFHQSQILNGKIFMFLGKNWFLLFKLFLLNILLFLLILIFIVVAGFPTIIALMLKNEAIMIVLILIISTVVEISQINDGILLLIGLANDSIFGLFECEELVLHIDTLFVLNLDNILDRDSSIVEPTKLFPIDSKLKKIYFLFPVECTSVLWIFSY